MEVAEDEVNVQGSFVRLVDDECVILLKAWIVPCFSEEDSVGHELHLRRDAVGSVFEANLISDLASEFDLEFFRHTTGHRSGGDTSRLGAADPAPFSSPSHFEGDFRKLGRLPGTRVAADDHDLMRHQAGPDVITSLRDREVFWKGKIHAGALMAAGGGWCKRRCVPGPDESCLPRPKAAYPFFHDSRGENQIYDLGR